MSTSISAHDPLDILLHHDAWATREMLNACTTLSPEAFHRRFEMGPGSLHDTLTHILGAARNWGDYLASRPLRPRLEGTQRSIDQLLALLDEISADLRASAKLLPLGDTVSREREGKVFVFTRATVLMQIATHSVHHRAQCLNMLRQIGVNPLPKSSVTEWSRAMGESNH